MSAEIASENGKRSPEIPTHHSTYSKLMSELFKAKSQTAKSSLHLHFQRFSRPTSQAPFYPHPAPLSSKCSQNIPSVSSEVRIHHSNSTPTSPLHVLIFRSRHGHANGCLSYQKSALSPHLTSIENLPYPEEFPTS